jgi:hypothetical protein
MLMNKNNTPINQIKYLELIIIDRWLDAMQQEPADNHPLRGRFAQ